MYDVVPIVVKFGIKMFEGLIGIRIRQVGIIVPLLTIAGWMSY